MLAWPKTVGTVFLALLVPPEVPKSWLVSVVPARLARCWPHITLPAMARERTPAADGTACR